MYITTEKIKVLRELFDEQKQLTEIISDQIKTAQDRRGENLLIVERDGQNVNIKENDLWKEVYYGGIECNGALALKKEYPQIFEAYEKDQEIAKKLKDFTLFNFGFSFNNMTLVNLIDLIRAVRRYELLRFFFIDRILSLYYAIFRKKD